MTKKTLSGLFAGFLALLPVTAAHSQVVGEVGVDWIGNDIVIEIANGHAGHGLSPL